MRIYTRTGKDWTDNFSTLAHLLKHLSAHTAILDGKILALNNEGISSFKELQNNLSEGIDAPLRYYVFDLLYLNGKNLTELPLLKRKAKLASLLKNKHINTHIFFSEHFITGIGGFTLSAHASRGIRALFIGYYEHGNFLYAGKVSTGFDSKTSHTIRKKLNALEQATMPFSSIFTADKRGAKWVKPTLVCEVEFTEWTADKKLRHPSFLALREDKPASTID